MSSPAVLKQRAGLRLGFISGRMCALENGELWCHPGLGRLVDALAARVSEVTVGLSLAPQRHKTFDHRLAISRDQFVALPWLPSTIAGLSKDVPCRKLIAQVEARSDVVVFQLPFSPPTALAPAAKPRVYHVCADVPNVVRASPFYTGAKRAAALGLADAIHWWTRALVHRQRCRVATNGRALMERLGHPPGFAGVSSSMIDSEIGSVVRRRPRNAPFRVLFVGYIRPEKGIDVLMEAYRLLLNDLPDTELVLVGEQDLSEGGAALQLRKAVNALGSRGKVTELGHRPFGPELFAEFADADVLALPSRSEGTPRVLVEARAFGCPVVATNVGGIPTSVTDGEDGLLIPPNDAPALHRALLKVARDAGLRNQLVERGFASARNATVEAFAEKLLDQADLLRMPSS